MADPTRNQNKSYGYSERAIANQSFIKKMDFDTFRTYCLAKNGAEESFPYPRKPDMLVFKVRGKMFACADVSDFGIIRLKFAPEQVQSLRDLFVEVSEPAYLSKKHWNQIDAKGNLRISQIKAWIDDSYGLVVEKLPTKR